MNSPLKICTFSMVIFHQKELSVVMYRGGLLHLRTMVHNIAKSEKRSFTFSVEPWAWEVVERSVFINWRSSNKDFLPHLIRCTQLSPVLWLLILGNYGVSPKKSN